MPVKHTFTSAIPDDVVPAGKVQPSHWNADHDLSGVVPADLPAFARKGFMAKDTASTYRSFWPTGTPTAAPHTLNAWRAQLIVVPFEMTVIPAVNVITAVASSKINAALYLADATTGLPVTRAVDFGVFDTSTTGLKTNSAVTVPPGEYWFVYVPTGATTGSLSTSAAAAQTSAFTRLQITAGAAGTSRVRIESTSTGVTPLPATLSGITWTETTSAISSPVYVQVQ